MVPEFAGSTTIANTMVPEFAGSKTIANTMVTDLANHMVLQCRAVENIVIAWLFNSRRAKTSQNTCLKMPSIPPHYHYHITITPLPSPQLHRFSTLLNSMFFPFRALSDVDIALRLHYRSTSLLTYYTTPRHHDHRTDNTTNYTCQLKSSHGLLSG